MKFNTQDPDIETIYRRIKEGDYDLQPDFQRGEVWTLKKQQRLIDTILRGWHIPPVHLVSRAEGRSDVLDGQQRLTAIRDYMDGVFEIDGTIQPLASDLEQLDGLRYSKLPDGVRRQFKKFTIRIFELTDYGPEEPHELFFRLNQPTTLTEAEKRNAFIGGPRNQIKDIVTKFSEHGLTKDRIGFSNARMAYDDLVGRLMLTLENGTLLEKITAGRITERYRITREFSPEVVHDTESSMSLLLSMPMLNGAPQIRPNKATIHTWLCLISRLRVFNTPSDDIEKFNEGVSWIEQHRWNHLEIEDPQISSLLRIFHDRATARVADVSSVILRDLCASALLESMGFWTRPTTRQMVSDLFSNEHPPLTDRELYHFASAYQWGETWEL